MELLSKNNLLGHVHTRPTHQDPGREDAEAFEKAQSLKCSRVIFHWQYMQGKQSPKLQQAAFIWCLTVELLKSNVLMTNLGILSKCRFWLSRSGMRPEICLSTKLLSGAEATALWWAPHCTASLKSLRSIFLETTFSPYKKPVRYLTQPQFTEVEQVQWSKQTCPGLCGHLVIKIQALCFSSPTTRVPLHTAALGP